MITYVNSKDAELFNIASAKLGVNLDSVDAYLSKLAELKAISPRFVRLPLYEDGHEDEEIFEIDANARTIKVPSTFSKNGVGVVSDELAETIWFKINRYFDIKDFGLAAGDTGEELKDGNLHILIQWEAPDGAKGASWAYAVDIDTDEDYVYFGWALTAEHLTAKAGNIKFAIRILQYGVDGDIIYSFATQAAQIAVKAGLSFDLTDEEQHITIESVADKIAHRLMGAHIANCPVFAPATEEPAYAGGDLPAYILNLQNGEATLEVSAAAPKRRVEDPEHPGEFIEEDDPYDAIAYKWYKKTAEDEDFVLVAEDDRTAEGQYTPALTVTASGQYYVVVFGMREIVDGEEHIYHPAQGEVGDEDYVEAGVVEGKFKYHTSVASSKSTICTIPEPIALHFISAENGGADMPAFILLENEPAIGLVASRQIIINPNTNQEMRVGETSIKIEKTASAEKGLNLAAAEFTEVDVDDSPISIAINEETGAITIGMSAAGEGEDAPREYAGEGYYRVSVINTLNGDEKETLLEDVCRAVYPASIGEVTLVAIAADSEEIVSQPSKTAGDRIKATVGLDGLLSDGLIYQWFEASQGVDPIDAENPNDDLIATHESTATTDIFKPDHQGTYYARVINIVESSQIIQQATSPITFDL